MHTYYLFSTDPWGRQCPITHTNDLPLQTALSWEEFPVLIATHEVETMNIQHVKRVIKGTLLTPSQGALLNVDNLFETSKLVDRLFQKAIKGYYKALLDASEKDKEKITAEDDVKQELLDIRNKSIGVVYEGHLREASVYRIAWLKTVDILERERLKKTEKTILRRCKDLHDELELAKTNSIVDIDSLNELEQLGKIYYYVFHHQNILFGTRSLQTYLKDDFEIDLQAASNTISFPLTDPMEELISLAINQPQPPQLLEQENNEIVEPQEVTDYREKASQGNAIAQNNLGWCYATGFGVKKDMEKALEYFLASAETGLMQAEYNVASCYDVRTDIHKLNASRDESFLWYFRAAERGLAEAQHMVGFYYYYGWAVNKDLCVAVDWFQKAEKQNYASAQSMLGNCHEFGEGVEKDTRKAFKLHLLAAKQGIQISMSRVGAFYKSGIGTVKDEMEGIKWAAKGSKKVDENKQDTRFLKILEESAIPQVEQPGVQIENNGEIPESLDSLYNRGNAYELQGNYLEALAVYRRGAELGHTLSKFKMGVFYDNGWGVEKDEKLAVNWYFEASDQGEPLSHFNLGCYHLHGKGRVIVESVQEFEFRMIKSAELGFINAVFKLAEYYKKSAGSNWDTRGEKYVKWLEKGVHKYNSVEAMCKIGDFFRGRICQNDKKAAEWYQKAADLGYAPAQLELGLIYSNKSSKDELKNYEKGAELIQNALANQHQLTSQQISIAKERLDWLKSGNCIIL